MLEQFSEHGPQLAEHPPIAVGHRVVHGGARFFAPTLIDALAGVVTGGLVLAVVKLVGRLRGKG